MATKSRTKRNIFIAIIFTVTALFFIVVGAYYYIFEASNFKQVEDATYLYIYDTDSFEDVVEQLKTKSQIKNLSSFIFVAKQLKYDKSVKSGRYLLTDNMANLKLVRQLRSGIQEPLQLKFNNIRTKEQLAGRIASQLMADSISLINLLEDEAYVEQLGFTPQTIIAMFIPNTYEIYWNTGADAFFQRMKREYESFWNASRKDKAKTIPMNPIEVITLASIIQEESNKNDEYPIIAGLYINRIKIGMPLQACPTVKFALGDFTLRRILNKHLQVESPYNTYKNKGLPPGPIRTPSIVCIDAVLNYAKHDYLFMAADASMNGRHVFAKTGAEHMSNARKYQQVLNAKGIK